ncbi:MAG: Bax inhibitor-1/YccA family protein [Acholeplasmatales bacterium]|nr:Bax inhibitor-1/YccA family protein [Acholeplasmatales bacterium]
MKNNPVFSNIETNNAYYDEVERATYKGISIKTFVLLGIAILVAAMVAFYLPTILVNNPEAFYGMLIGSSIIGFISVMVGRMSARASKYASAIYAMCEGIFLGSLTWVVESVYPGVAGVAVFSALAIFAVMLTLFATGILRVGSKMRRFCFALTLGAMAILLITSITYMFGGVQNIGVLILIEAFLLFYGVITLSLNFDEARFVVNSGASKDAEWTVALGLMVSLVYIYIEIVRLLVLIAASRD